MSDWRKTTNYRKWRAHVIRRDTKCVICSSRKKRAAHHIKNGSHHAESRFDIENGVTLCYKCHMNFHTNFKNSYREKCTEKDWYNFKMLMEYAMNIEKEVNEI